MDVPYRAMKQQHLLIYVAALEDSSPAVGEVSNISITFFAGFDLEEAGFLEHTLKNECDVRFEDYGVSYIPTTYDPRCRPWYQDAIGDINTGVIFTNPYPDAGSGLLTITVAAPVYNTTNAALLIGVVGIDMDFTGIENSINDATVIHGEDGYAYLLAPGGDGEVAVHWDLDASNSVQYIVDLEEGVDKEEFGNLITRMSKMCNGSDLYSKNGDTWILSWKHDVISGAARSGSYDCGTGGFISVVTVSEYTLLQEFSQIETDARNIVTVATAIMVVALVMIGFVTVGVTLLVSKSIVEPVNELIDFVHMLSSMDFSKQPAGTWMINEVSCAEVGDLMRAFQSMSTVVKFANTSLKSGNLEVAKQNLVNALILFKKLGNDRGVAIVNNNLGTVYTLEAQNLASKALPFTQRNKAAGRKFLQQADSLYSDAIANYKLAIDHADLLYTESKQQGQCSSTQPTSMYPAIEELEDDAKESHTTVPTSGEARVAVFPSDRNVRGPLSDRSLAIQLSNRKFNLAVCLAAKGKGANPTGAVRDPHSIAEARDTLHQCIQLAFKSEDERGDEWRVKYLLELAALEIRAKVNKSAGVALDAAESIVATYRGGASVLEEGTALFRIACVLHQRLLAVRGTYLVGIGDIGAAIDCWTCTILGCGDKMDTRAVLHALDGLMGLTRNQDELIHFPSELLKALGLPLRRRTNLQLLTSAIASAVGVVQRQTQLTEKKDDIISERGYAQKTSVDLCFLMDCTGSMQRWIDQAKDKLTEIIKQAKKDVINISLRVAFVGYRDFGDLVQYEGPYDFHEEAKLPSLLAKLKKIRATGGKDIPEDVAGGLLRVKNLSWRSSVRLCILIADAPCHGLTYHNGLWDRYPNGCPKRLDPAKLLHKLQYELEVDFYFIKITAHTDKMINVLRKNLLSLETTQGQASRRTKINIPKFEVRDLGSNDNRFLETVMSFLKVSMNLIIEE